MYKIIKELTKAYEGLNKELFGGNLPGAVINISYNQKKPKNEEDTTLGIFYPDIKWTKGNNNYIAISITSDAIHKKELVTILSVLVHEMVHGYCKVMNIDDMEEKNKKKHNIEFKEYAEMAKLEVQHHNKVGWGATFATSELIGIFNSIDIDRDVFNVDCEIIYKENEKKKSGKKKKFKHLCPICQRKVETKDGKLLICGICNVDMSVEAPDEVIEE